MPPQQGHTLLDLVDDGLDLGTHGRLLASNRVLAAAPAFDGAAGTPHTIARRAGP